MDEAGFGPLLGPLVIGATAWRVPEGCDGGELWRRLRGGVSKTPGKRLASLAINDSKKIYSPQRGLLDLERGVLGTFAVMPQTSRFAMRNAECGIERRVEDPAPAIGGRGMANPEFRIANSDGGLRFGRFLDRLVPDWAEQVNEHPWYDGCGELALPVAGDRGDLATRANGLRVAMGRGGVEFLGAGLELVAEGRFNRLCEAIGNKGRVLFCCTARLIQRLLERFGRERLTVVCDKHGGRDSYRSLLMSHWPELRLTVLEESAARSGYRLAETAAAARAMDVWFVPRADVTCLPAALASMYCKYTRELFMRLLNGFWRAQVGQELAATAGYYTDGQRFIGQVAEAARRLGLPAEAFVRSR